jgi:hypothetical protein
LLVVIFTGALGPQEINSGLLATYLADRVTVAWIGTGNGLILIVGKRMATGRLTNWLIGWLNNGWLTNWISDWPTDRVADLLSDWMTNWINDWLTDQRTKLNETTYRLIKSIYQAPSWWSWRRKPRELCSSWHICLRTPHLQGCA